MPGLELEATDGSGRIALPAGETVIGRGPFLGIADKRVSRNHGLLEVVGERLRIKSVHVNPCFYQASDKGQLLPLERNKWQWLCEGDRFSLLPDTFIFKVTATHSDMDSTLSNSQILDEDEETFPESTSNIQLSKVVENKPSCSASDKPGKAQLGLGSQATTSGVKRPCKSSSESTKWNEELQQAKSNQRKRELPAWMLQEGLDVKPLPCSPAKTGSSRRKGKVEQIASADCPQGRKRLPPADDYERNAGCEQEVEKKSRIKTEQKGHAPKQKGASRYQEISSLNVDNDEDRQPRKEETEYKNTSTTPNTTKTSQVEKSDDEEKASLNASPLVRQSKAPQSHEPSNEDQEMELSSSPAHNMAASASNADSRKVSIQPTSSKRIPCGYGQQCYRKNPAHFQQFSHPGDSDFLDGTKGSQDDEDERPECPYGTDCYRKNPQHKLEYKHTKPAGRSVLQDDSDDDGEANAYDLEDSFIDDEEEEYEPTDEDSDYEPDSEEKDTEDMDTLMKEANTFVKTKK
ncbi:aprataxin and PNK-like factor isoform X2 [Ambystoma mexicanum]|uniref:aprataxin and PNK-like factor isoform X2 n=1 Tax=Ambystoma mexicanum TaxID=8296 RepID=UPI0037E98440